MSDAAPRIRLNVHLLPELTHPHELAGEFLIVIDVLRATSTITAALDAGAREIVPCLEVDEARQIASQRQRHDAIVLGGERGGQPIVGFDLGNSPHEYRSEQVKDRVLVFTTTNGTRAMMRCIGAGRVLLGSFANLSAVSRMAADERRVDLICAGTDGHVSWEDTLCAGAIVDRLNRRGAELNDAARLAWHAWQQLGGSEATPERLAEAMRHGQGGRNLLGIERGDDIPWAANIDQSDAVPELYLDSWSIRAACPTSKTSTAPRRVPPVRSSDAAGIDGPTE